jgi:type IV pilus assembly protein PilW
MFGHIFREHKKQQGGFTLIELMISLAIFGLLSLGAFSVLSSGQRTAVQNDQTVQVQQNVRLAMDLISRDLRMAGYGNPAANSLGGCTNHLNATDNGPLGLLSDQISVMTVNEQVGTVAVDFSAGNVLRVRGMNNAAPNVANQSVITIEGVFTAQVNGAPSVVDSQTSDLTLGKTGSPATPQGISAPQVFLAGTPVLTLTCVTYTVSGAGANPPYQLMRATAGAAAVALVDGIEALQFAYAVDTNKDGVIDDQGGSAAGFDCLDYIPNRGLLPNNTNGCTAVGTVATIPSSFNVTPTPVRQIRITVVARALPPAAANRVGNTWNDPTYLLNSAITTENLQIAHAPGIRRRTLTKIISLRNAF